MYMTMPSNSEFIDAIFGVDAPWCHVSDFTHDPSNIPSGMAHLIAWKGDYFSRYQFHTEPSNQYFTISTFYADEKGTARRRKALYRQTHCIVLDDVKEKLVQSEVDKLPAPAWILETSPGSEQWGYILDVPSQARTRVENLLDGLIANGLAPDGRDSGMKGVTRYVRLPDGYNNKAKKLVNGQPHKCRMLLWEPTRKTSMEALAAPLKVNLDAERRDQRTDGAAEVSDHPILETDTIHVKEVRSDGRFDITCPWVDEHTGQEDSGSAIFTNADGTIGFKCHHGNCQEKTGADLLNKIEAEHQGFKASLSMWQVMRSFGAVADAEVVVANVSPEVTVPLLPVPPAAAPVQADTIPAPVQAAAAPPAPPAPVDSYDVLIGMLRAEIPNTPKSRHLASEILKSVDSAAAMDRMTVHEQVRDILGWSKPDFKLILKDLRETWYTSEQETQQDFFNDVVYISELNQFFDRDRRIFYTAEAFQNSYSHVNSEARKDALENGRVKKVHKLDFAPMMPDIFVEDGITYGNTWTPLTDIMGTEGDVTPWLRHFDTLGWGEHRKHVLQWMAFTLLHPEHKINHMVMMGSGEGGGKDWLLYPLTIAMGKQAITIDGEKLLSDFNPYLLATKYLHINEAELGDRKEATQVANRLKPLAAAPPEKLSVNDKGVKNVQIRNVVNCTMTTNSRLPIRLNGPSRRMFCLWSDFNFLDSNLEMTDTGVKFWKEHWNWMKKGGAEMCIWHLRNRVDLTDFDPGKSPPVTDFLRDILNASKSPLQLSIERLIEVEMPMVAHDIVSAQDVYDALVEQSSIASQEVYISLKNINPVIITGCLKQMLGMSGWKSGHGVLFSLTKKEQYMFWSTQEIIALYEQRIPVESRVVLTENGRLVDFNTTTH
jgi:hypothetical protein